MFLALISIVPPLGMASRAFKARLRMTSSSSPGSTSTHHNPLGKGGLNLYIAAQASIQQLPHVAGQPLEIHRLRLQRLASGKRQQLTAQAGAAVDRLAHGREDLFAARGVGLAAEHLQAAGNDLQ